MVRKDSKEKSIQLRKEGKSLNQIVEIVHASKGSVSAWVRDVQLTEEQKQILIDRKSKNGGYHPFKKDGSPRKKRSSNKFPRIKKYNTEYEIKGSRNSRMTTYRNKIKIRAVEYKGGKCEVEGCGYNKCIDALEFHHINPEEKEFGVSQYPYGWERLKKELDKCILVCSNHHKEIHYEMRNNKKINDIQKDL